MGCKLVVQLIQPLVHQPRQLLVHLAGAGEGVAGPPPPPPPPAAGGGGPYAPRLTGVAGAWAADDATLVISLAAPNGSLPALLDVPIVLEQEEGPPLGTGYYQYEAAGERLYLQANPRHSGHIKVQQGGHLPGVLPVEGGYGQAGRVGVAGQQGLAGGGSV